MKNITGKLNCDLYLNAAEQLGLDIILKDKASNYFEITNGQKTISIYNNITSLNDAVSYTVARNKATTNRLLNVNNIPVPEQIIFERNSTFEEVRRKSEGMFPVVLKPIYGSFGKNVFVNLRTSEELLAAYEELTKKNAYKFIVEKFVRGVDYRIVVADGEVIDVVERIPAYIIGDGVSSIKKLIEKKNFRRMVNNMKQIPIDEKLNMQLKRHQLTLKSIADINAKITLRNNCNFSEGGETKRVNLDTIPLENLKMLAKCATIANLRLCGVDFICQDITLPYTNQVCGVNEINSNPHLEVNYHADNLCSIEPVIKILDKAFQ